MRSIPSVRGNLGWSARWQRYRRSIPARTGEPITPQVAKHVWRVYPRAYGGPATFCRAQYGGQVYPRAYGGTADRSTAGIEAEGLSPRVRGNRYRDRRGQRTSGSIPARTGEPYSSRDEGCSRPVYPRAYGGTRLSEICPVIRVGLSPRVRGNLQRHAADV